MSNISTLDGACLHDNSEHFVVTATSIIIDKKNCKAYDEVIQKRSMNIDGKRRIKIMHIKNMNYLT
jgi:hypothetical protein